jgi:acyl-CoA synthetase (AMP-forming)/AMP-acid ligase II/thioesterase domain-containing protein
MVGDLAMPEGSTRPPLTLEKAILDTNWDEGSHALEGVDGRAMTYGELKSKIRWVVGVLNRAGYHRGDRFATALNNGPEQFAAIIALMAGFTVAPINPTLKEEEMARHMKLTRVKAVVVDDMACPATKVARSLGMEVYELTKADGGDTLVFGLKGKGMDNAPEPEPEFATEDDLIAIFGTSGTTGRPKLVPVKQSSIFWSHHFYMKVFRDWQKTRYLAVLPIFYAHGLLSPLRILVCGGCVIYAPSFDPHNFFRWLDAAKPTAMTAGPTLYQAIMQHAGENADVIGRNRLKYISTGNAAMPNEVMDQLEKTFGVPVLETYAMTEVPIITMNPPPPGKSKRGSAGVSWGTEVAIMDEGGELLPDGKLGEIVVKGPAVMGGYEGDPEANRAAFRDGWFRTGDIGYFDDEKYLYIKGRLKELINRGGEKIAPREVEEALLTHPAVREAAVFPVKHRKLGEDVAAAVVLKDGASATDSELKVHVSKKLAHFKVPSRVVIVGELPKGATGKISRAGMAESLGMAKADWGESQYLPPRTETERRLVGLLEKVAPGGRVGINDNLFDLGIYSLMAVRLFSEMEGEFGVKLPLSTLFQSPRVGDIAALLEGGGGERRWKGLVPLQSRGSGPPLFLVHGGDGDIVNYQELVKALGEGRKIYGIQARGLDGKGEPQKRVEEIAEGYLEEISKVQAGGPYYLMGFSAGGVIAFEMARQLEEKGKRAAFVGVIDMDAPDFNSQTIRQNSRRNFFRQFYFLLRDMRPNSPKKRAGMDLRLLKRVVIIAQSGLGSLGIRSGDATTLFAADAVVLPKARKEVWLTLARAVLNYKVRQFGGRVTVFKGQGIPFVYSQVGGNGWEMYAKGGADVFVVPGRMHGSQLRAPNVDYLAALTNGLMEKAGRPA